MDGHGTDDLEPTRTGRTAPFPSIGALGMYEGMYLRGQQQRWLWNRSSGGRNGCGCTSVALEPSCSISTSSPRWDRHYLSTSSNTLDISHTYPAYAVHRLFVAPCLTTGRRSACISTLLTCLSVLRFLPWATTLWSIHGWRDTASAVMLRCNGFHDWTVRAHLHSS